MASLITTKCQVNSRLCPSQFPKMSLVLSSRPPWDPGMLPFGCASGGQWSLKCFLPFPRDDRLRHGQGRGSPALPEPGREEQRPAARGCGRRPAPVSGWGPCMPDPHRGLTWVLESLHTGTSARCHLSPRESSRPLSWAFPDGCLAAGMGLRLPHSLSFCSSLLRNSGHI